MADVYYGEDQTVKIYRWAEKEVAEGTINGTNTTFHVDNEIASITGLSTDPFPDYYDSTTGELALRDVAIYYRKDNTDTRVDSDNIASISGTTITFSTAPTTDDADSIVVSYGYADEREDWTYQVTEFSKSGGAGDIDVTYALGNKSYIRHSPQEPVEISLTVIKKDPNIVQAMNGEIVSATDVTGYTGIDTVSGGRTRTPRAVCITSQDPENSSIKLIVIARNVKGTSAEFSGGSEDLLTDSVTFKCKAEDYAEISTE